MGDMGLPVDLNQLEHRVERGGVADALLRGVLYTRLALAMVIHLSLARVRAGAEVRASPQLAFCVRHFYG
jgi:hypothetical protein